MNRTRLSLIALLLAAGATTAVVGCGSRPDADESATTGEAEQSLKRADNLFGGTWENRQTGFGEIHKLTFNSDGTYDAEVEAGPLEIVCVRAPCTIPQRGTFKGYESEYTGNTYLRLQPEGSQRGDWYRATFAMDGGPMSLYAYSTKITSTLSPRRAITCEVDGKTYNEGDAFDSPDGCNTCSCTEWGAMCTELYCPPTCNYGGKNYVEGDTFPSDDSCNSCSCTDRGVICTELACAKTCDFGGKTYFEGDSFPSTDGCNSCACTDRGVICTELFCPN